MQLWSTNTFFYFISAQFLHDQPISFSLLLLMQVFTAIVTGMAGYAGATLQREPMPPKTALNILVTLTLQVSSEALLISCYPLMVNSPSVLCWLKETGFNHTMLFFQKRQLGTVEKMVSGSTTQRPAGFGPTIHSVQPPMRRGWG